MNNKILSIVTTTYNRGNLLPNLYQSLLRQTSFHFEWIIIDDGSTDNTKNVVSKFKTNKFPIIYKKKKNTGKCSSLNFCHSCISGNYIFVVDSDDTLTSNAVSTILEDWNKVSNDDNVCSLSYQKMDKNYNLVSDADEKDYVISNHIEYRINQFRTKDRAESVDAKLFKKFSFPEFSNEKFIGEEWLWNTLGMLYKTLYIAKPIYICEYQENGLSAKGKILLLSSPNLMSISTKTYLNYKINFRIRIKKCLLFLVYQMFAGKKFKDINVMDLKVYYKFFLWVPSRCVYLFWKNRYNVLKEK